MTSERKTECHPHHPKGQGHHSHGPSSAWLHDTQTVLEQIPLKSGQVFVDLGCGAGDYTLKAASMVGQDGRVYALEKWPYLIDRLSTTVESLGMENVSLLTADILTPLPLGDQAADVVFVATVLHIFRLEQIGGLLTEISRILAPGGCLAVIECKKEDQPFGPPQHMRYRPDDIETALKPYGFEKTGYHDLGYNYLILFALRG